MSCQPAAPEGVLNSANFIILIHIAIVLGFGLRVVSRQPPPGVAFAWLLLVSVLPVGGALLYLLFGERRISATRSKQFARSRKLRQLTWQKVMAAGRGDGTFDRGDAAPRGLIRLGWVSAASPAVDGTATQLAGDFDAALDGIIADIDGARCVVLVETYIWENAGRIAELEAALARAAGRGVQCRVLVDTVGSQRWLRSESARLLRSRGVKVVAALPVGLWASIFGRADLRLHRKIVTVDTICAWTGSMNMVDPRHFKQDAGVGEWMDAMVRVEGTIVASLVATVLGDLAQERDQNVAELIGLIETAVTGSGGAPAVQAIPSGPGTIDDGLQLMLISLIGSAQERLIITTPYFAPDEALFKSLRAAAGRGVRVTLVLPLKIDSIMMRYASRSFFSGLLEAGMEVTLFGDGLLHTKSITVDGRTAMFGSVNMDYRSLWLNYEIALFFYDKDFPSQLEALQEGYAHRSVRLDPATWEQRSRVQRFTENLFRLFSPLL